MPLLSEVADYDDWRGRYHEMGKDVVYPPVRLGIDYVVNNLNGSKHKNRRFGVRFSKA